MLGWNSDPLANNSYDSLDTAAYPYFTANYVVYYNPGSGVIGVNTGLPWDPAKKIYIVYDTDGYFRHYNGNTLLYTSPFYGLTNIVYIDSSLYIADATYCAFRNVRAVKKAWNGERYI
jgi:hypothetical protein